MVSALVSQEPLFSAATIATARWIAHRYGATLGAVLHHASPGRFSAPPAAASQAPASLPEDEGLSWLDAPIEGAIAKRKPAVVVAPTFAHELEAMRAAVAGCGGHALIVAPRTSLVAQAAAAIPGSVAMHGDMRPAARARAWAMARDGGAPVVVGSRAAVLAPVSSLGLVAVVAAHDRNHKEERSPRLHALWTAMRRARDEGAAFVASSPAPPLDLTGPRAARFAWLGSRRERERGVHTEISSPRGGPLTARLVEAVREAVSAGGDALVFVARRGTALRVRCAECGWYPRCDACGTGLAMFQDAERRVLRCRSCGTPKQPPAVCPDCGSAKLGGVGWGSERLAHALAALDLAAPVIRADSLAPLETGRPRPAIVVGTQTAIYALEPGPVRAVCVADLDQLLGFPDFRASEHAFQTLQELAALASPDGRFLLQTREPEHHAVQAFTRRSFRYFASRELPLRRAAGYPPFGEVVRVDLDPASASDLDAAARAAGGSMVGPLVRPDGRAAALVRVPDVETLLGLLREFRAKHPSARADVDPVDVL
jgi:primosomal protein N' (replication factor Y)